VKLKHHWRHVYRGRRCARDGRVCRNVASRLYRVHVSMPRCV